jgi:hypothetical protein
MPQARLLPCTLGFRCGSRRERLATSKSGPEFANKRNFRPLCRINPDPSRFHCSGERPRHARCVGSIAVGAAGQRFIIDNRPLGATHGPLQGRPIHELIDRIIRAGHGLAGPVSIPSFAACQPSTIAEGASSAARRMPTTTSSARSARQPVMYFGSIAPTGTSCAVSVTMLFGVDRLPNPQVPHYVLRSS